MFSTMFSKIAVVAILCLVQAAVQAADLPSYPFVHVTGSAMTYAMPDVGEIDLEVNVIDADPERARALLEERLAAVRALLATHGVPEGDVSTRDVRRDMPKGGPVPDTYRLRCGVRIKVSVLASWSRIVGGLLSMPNLDEFSVAFDAVNRSQIEGELMAQALKNARRKAQDMAIGIGRKLGQASAVSSGEVRNVSRAMGLVATDFPRPVSSATVVTDRDSLAAISVLRMHQHVDVLFALK